MEHLQHFGLSEDPFRNEPRSKDFFETAPGRDALARLGRGVRQGRGLCVFTGDVGSGKTMIVRQLLESLEEELFEACMLVVLNGGADAHWMLTRFARLLGVEQPDPGREPLLAQVYERLAIVREDGRQTVLIIDDAHALASPAALVEVCGLLKLEYEERRLFSLVLCGGPELEGGVASNPTLSRRVEIRVRMDPLDAEGSAAYLQQRVRQAGGVPAILDPEAVAALHDLGRGLPGLMNNLADNALFEAFLCGRQQLTRTDVERAHRDLGWSAEMPGFPVFGMHGGAPLPGASGVGLASSPAGDLDSDLEAVFEAATAAAAELDATHLTGPPKDEDEDGEELLVELVEG